MSRATVAPDRDALRLEVTALGNALTLTSQYDCVLVLLAKMQQLHDGSRAPTRRRLKIFTKIVGCGRTWCAILHVAISWTVARQLFC